MALWHKSSTKRLLEPKDIPQSLWDGENLLRLPQSLRDAYLETLTSSGLLEEARKALFNGAKGGESREETDLHFAHRFDGSCARVELAVLDPKGDLSAVSNHFIRAFSGGRIRLLDIPCGCGAASATLLTTVAELRHRRILPREPLEVFLTAGDISCTARHYTSLIFKALKQDLHDQGIFVELSLPYWDINDAASTKVLLNKWLTAPPDRSNSFLLLTNFSGFWSADKNLERVEERVGELFRWARAYDSTAVWLEPPVKKKLVERLREWFRGKFAKLMGWLSNPAEPSVQLTTEAKFVQPLRESQISVRLLLLRLEGPSR